MAAEATVGAERAGSAEVDAYLAVSFEPGSEAAKDLMGRVDADLRMRKLYLTDLAGEQPRHLTPQMLGWFLAYVAPRRAQALASIRSAFAREKMARGGKGFLFEEEQDLIADQHIIEKRNALNAHREQNRVTYERLDALKAEVEKLRDEYGDHRSRLGREPVVTNWYLYSFALFLVFVAEAFINYESFLSLKWATPFIATGMTFLIAFAISMAAHLHGSLLKQFEFYFGDGEPDVKRGPAWRMMSMGSTALAVSLTAVYYARSSYFADLAGVGAVFGEKMEATPLWVIGGALLGNILVYLVGVALAWYQHDAVPDYPKLRQEFERKDARMQAIEATLEKARERRLSQLSAVAQKRREESERARVTFSKSNGYGRIRELFESVSAQDQRVLGLLQDYRTRLVSRLSGQEGAVLMLALEDRSPMRGTDSSFKSITGEQYLAEDLSLKYL